MRGLVFFFLGVLRRRRLRRRRNILRNTRRVLQTGVRIGRGILSSDHGVGHGAHVLVGGRGSRRGVRGLVFFFLGVLRRRHRHGLGLLRRLGILLGLVCTLGLGFIGDGSERGRSTALDRRGGRRVRLELHGRDLFFWGVCHDRRGPLLFLLQLLLLRLGLLLHLLLLHRLKHLRRVARGTVSTAEIDGRDPRS